MQLDNFADRVIKESFLGKLLSPFVIYQPQTNNKPGLSKIILFISICFLFTSLLFPQYSDNRLGIGLFILFCFFIFLIHAFTQKRLVISFNTIDLCILLFLLLGCISTFSSYFFKESLIGLSKYCLFILWYFLIKITIANSSTKSFLSLWSLVFFSSVIISLIGVYQYFIGVEPLATWEDSSYENIHTRVYSTLGNPNLLAAYLLLILPMGAVLSFKQEKNSMKALYLIGCLSLLVCLVFTGSRGGYIGLLSMLALSIVIAINYLVSKAQQPNKLASKKIIFIGVITLLVLGALFLFPIIQERLLTIFTLREHSSNNYRVNVWLSCIQILKDNWLIGIGPGNNTFRLAYGLYMKSSFDALGAYNVFLEIAIEIGVIGLVTFVLIFLLSFLKLHRLFWTKGNTLAIGISLSLIGLIVHGMVDTVFFRPQIFIPFWFLLASIGKLESET